MRRVLAGLLCATIVGCSGDPTRPAELGDADAAVQVADGETFQLRPGQVARVGTQGLSVAFRAVKEDSRCPEGTACVWAGDAAVALEVSTGGEGWAPVQLHTNGTPRQVQHGGYTLALKDLLPHPKAGTEIRANQYVVVLQAARQ